VRLVGGEKVPDLGTAVALIQGPAPPLSRTARLPAPADPRRESASNFGDNSSY